MTVPAGAGRESRLREELASAAQVPYGQERTLRVEAVVAEADETGDAPLALDARLDLMSCYSYGGEPVRRYPVFAWIVDRFEAEPGLFTHGRRHRLLWTYKWVTAGVVAHPEISLHRIEAAVADMAAHYAAAGEGQAPVLKCRFQIAAHVHGHADVGAQERYRAWTRSPRTGLSDCPACESSTRAWHLAELGRAADAVAEAMPVLTGSGCIDQPQLMVAHVLPALLETGAGDVAAAEHLRAVRRLRTQPGAAGQWARHILACARAGRLEYGLGLLEAQLAGATAATPEEEMWLAAAGARLLRGLCERGRGDLPVTAPGCGDTAATAGAALERRALELAARFDARNGTDAVGTRIRACLVAGPLPDLPLDAVPLPARPAGSVPPPPPPPLTPPAGIPVLPAAAGLGELATALEVARAAGDAASRAAVVEAWRALRPSWEAVARGRHAPAEALAAARLEAAAAVEEVEAAPAPDRHALLDAVAHLGERLRRSGDPGGGGRFDLWWLRTAYREGRLDVTTALDRITDAVGEAADAARMGRMRPAELGSVHAAALGVLAVLEPDVTSADAARLVHERDTHVAAALAAFADAASMTGFERGSLAMVHRTVAAELPLPERLERLRVALELLPRGTRRGERALVGHALAVAVTEAGRPEEAVGLLTDAVEDAETAGDPEGVAHVLVTLARVRMAQGEADAAVELFTAATARFEALDQAAATGHARLDLAEALRAAGRHVEALEVAEAALRQGEARLAAAGVHPAPLPTPGAPVGEGGTPRLDVHVLGQLGLTAAGCAWQLGEAATAAELALRAAGWHARNGSALPMAVAIHLAADCGAGTASAADLYRLAAEHYACAGDPASAVTCLRAAAVPVLRADGLDAGLSCLDEARAVLAQAAPDLPEHRLRWEEAALDDQAARVLLGAGHPEEALGVCEDLAARYHQLGDRHSAREIVALRARALRALERTTEALTSLRLAVEEARADGEEDQARALAELLTSELGTGDAVHEQEHRRP